MVQDSTDGNTPIHQRANTLLCLSSMVAATFSPHEIGSDKVSDQRKGDRNHLLAISLFLVGNRISVRHMGISLKLSGTDHKNCRPQTSSQKGFSHETKFRPLG